MFRVKSVVAAMLLSTMIALPALAADGDISNLTLMSDYDFGPDVIKNVVKLDTDHALISGGDKSVYVVDISDPNAPQIVARHTYENQTGTIIDMDNDRNYAYITFGDGGLEVLSLNDPSAPFELSTNTDGYFGNISVNGLYAYVPRGSRYVIYDIRWADADSVGVYDNNGVDVVAVHAADTLLTMVGSSGAIAYHSISDPVHPEVLDSLVVGSTPGDTSLVHTSGFNRTYALQHNAGETTGTIYVGESGGSFDADVGSGSSTVSAPTALAVTPDSLLLVGGDGTGIRIHDAIPLSPTYMTLLDANALPAIRDIDVDTALVLAADEQQGLRLFDFSGLRTGDGLNVQGQVEPISTTYAMATGNNHLFVVGDGHKLRSVDVSDPSNPTLTSANYQIPNGLTSSSIVDMVVDGNYAYIAREGGDAVVVDISDPTNPSYVTEIQPTGLSGAVEAYSVALSGTTLYVGMSGSGADLVIFDVSNPAAPTQLGVKPGSDDYRHLFIDGTTLYASWTLSPGDDYVSAVDVSDPSSPVEFGSVGSGGTLVGLGKSGDNVYCMRDQLGFKVLDASDPSNMSTLADYTSVTGESFDLVVDGARALIANGANGVRSYNIQDPQNPVETGYYDTYGSATSLYQDGNTLYVGDGSGIAILELPPAPPTALALAVTNVDSASFPTIQVDVEVTNQASAAVTGLTDANFSLTEDMAAQTLQSVTEDGGGLGQYAIVYTTSNSTADETVRSLAVDVDYSSLNATASASYTAPPPPSIDMTVDYIHNSAFPDISLGVSVTDQLDELVTGLTDANFSLAEDMVGQSPLTLTGNEGALTISMQMYIGSSMDSQERIDQRTGIINFINHFEPGDTGEVAKYAGSQNLFNFPTGDTASLINVANLETIPATDGTEIYDALQTSAQMFRFTGEPSDIRIAMIIANGFDSGSDASYQRALDSLLHYDVMAYTVGLGPDADHATLQDFAMDTGGKYYYAETTAELPDLLDGIGALLHSPYELSFTTSNTAHDGSLRAVGVDVAYGGVNASADTSYTAPPPSPIFHVEIAAQMGVLLDQDVIAGLDTVATDDYDLALDIPKPIPPVSDFVSVYFSHPEWGAITGDNFLHDIRASRNILNETVTFDFVVDADPVGQTVELTFTPSATYTAGAGLTLHDHSAGVYQDLIADSSYSFTASASQTFSLIFGATVNQKNFAEGWHMLSLPAPPMEPAVSLADFVQGDSSLAFLFGYSAGNSYTLEDSLKYNPGYWMAVVDSGPAVGLYQGSPKGVAHEVNLNQSWNLIGAPFTNPVDVADLSFSDGSTTYSFSDAVTNGWVGTPTLYTYEIQTDGSNGYTMSSTLNPWYGYWMLITAPNLTMTVPVSSAVPTPRPSGEQIGPRHDQVEWMVPIAVTKGSVSQQLAAFGHAEEASEGFDPWYDLAAPPMAPGDDAVTLATTIDGHALATDIRAATTDLDQQIWAYQLLASQPGSVTLSFEQASSVPAHLAVLATVDGVQYDLRQTDEIQVAIGSEPKSLEILVTGMLSASGPGSGLPTEFAISKTYPNPFNPTMTATIALPTASELKVRVFNLMGQQVAQLASGRYEAGYHNLQFDGSHLASGVYYLNATVPGELNAVKKVVLMK